MNPCNGTPTWSDALKFFFCEYLPVHRGMSRDTQESYARALRFFVARPERGGRGPHEMTVKDVLDFLEGLERDRGNQASTRNVRLAGLNCFWKAMRLWDAAHRERYESLGEVPSKRCRQRSPDYLEPEELGRLFDGVDPKTPRGFRDLLLLRYLYNTGSRISEVAKAELDWLSLGLTPEVAIRGKGGKTRVCPLWRTTGELLGVYLRSERGQARPGFENRLFLTRQRKGFTRGGLWKLLRGHLDRAREKCPSLARKRLTPHSLRHTTAIHLLRAGVELTVIKAWLGHADVTTTSRYLDLNLATKREALERFLKLDLEKLAPTLEGRPAVLSEALVEWLETL